jgi:CelD/BcsL family acetyltransferase involved in cellulose biosynthesis
VDGRLVAGHFGLRMADTFHPWISAYDPAYEDYSPGVLLLYQVIGHMDGMGLQVYDLAGGHEYYKKYFAEPGRYVKDILISRPTLHGRIQHAGYSVWELLGARKPDTLAARIRRRMDHAAICEPSWGLRVKDFMVAVLKRGSSPPQD